MRWNINKIMKYKSGETRIVKRFLFIPKGIRGQFRWLETATFKQEYVYRNDPTCGASWHEWTDKEWLNN